MQELAQYRVNIPVTFTGIVRTGIFRKREVPYSITFTDDDFRTCWIGNARSVSSAFMKAKTFVDKVATRTVKEMEQREKRNDILIITGNTDKGKFEWSKPFIRITGYTLGKPEITKIKNWKDATMKELSNSNLSIPEFQEVFDQIKAREGIK